MLRALVAACVLSSLAACGGSAHTKACGALTTCCASAGTSESSCVANLGLAEQAADPDTACETFLEQYLTDGVCAGIADLSVYTDLATPDLAPAPFDALPPVDLEIATLPFTPSNITVLGVDATLFQDVDITSSTCTISSSASFISCLNGAQPPFRTIKQEANDVSIAVYYFKSFKLEQSAVLQASGPNPIAIVALATIEIDGTILVNGVGATAVAGGRPGALSGTIVGGTAIGNGGSATTMTTITGAGGAGYCGIGGSGENAGGAVSSNGGLQYGTQSLVPLAGGACGGGTPSVTGGAGGGAIQLVAGESITISGTVDASGGGGASGGKTLTQGGGGGSGGAVLMESKEVTINANAAVVVNGGGGGAGLDPHATPGTDGLTSIVGAPGGSAPTDGDTGGDGSTGTVNGGGNGVGNTSGQGGGGGAAGRIRINTASMAATINGTVSPRPSSACTSQGVLN